jgi:hypothetical protein
LKGSLVLTLIVVGAGWPQAAAAAPWCGTLAGDDRPAIVGGNHIRVLYAIPTDGADRSGELAPRISADVDEIDAWWRVNDATRAPRFDLTGFPCGNQIDLTLARLARPGAQIAPTFARFRSIAEDPQVERFFDGFSKLLVYYDGPTADEDICGEGRGSADGPGIAVVYLSACGPASTARTAAHELLHSFGAVALGGPPNGCPGDLAHVCDSAADILFPFTNDNPLSSVVLDLNRDDYYGHSGSWLDVRRSAWLRSLDAQAALAVAVTGGGSVTSRMPGIACTSTCQVDFNAGTQVSLVAQPAAGRKFIRWGGACSATFPQCRTTLDAARSVTALFAPPKFRLAVTVRGQGHVTSAAGISCPARCARQLPSFVRVTLRATSAKGWRLKAWSGACRGSRATCSVPMAAATSARAVFVRK